MVIFALSRPVWPYRRLPAVRARTAGRRFDGPRDGGLAVAETRLSGSGCRRFFGQRRDDFSGLGDGGRNRCRAVDAGDASSVGRCRHAGPPAALLDCLVGAWPLRSIGCGSRRLASPCSRCGDRLDARDAQLGEVIANSRLVLLPGVQIHGLASQALTLWILRVADDWQITCKVSWSRKFHAIFPVFVLDAIFWCFQRDRALRLPLYGCKI